MPALILFGLMADKVGVSASLTATYAVRFVSFIILLEADSAFLLYLFAAVFGLTSYTTAPLAAKLVMTSYGSKRGSTVYGLLVLLHMVGEAVGALFGGLIYEAYLSYQPAFLASTVLVAFAVLLSLYAQNLAKRC
ncbi:MAG: MFS transporter [Nitrososphaerales archaeon]